MIYSDLLKINTYGKREDLFNEETQLEMDLFFFLGPASLELISTEFFLGFRLQLKFIGTRF